MDIPIRNMPIAEAIDLERPIQSDLVAYFALVEDAALKLLSDAGKRGLTADEFIAEVERLLDGDNRAPETTAAPPIDELRVNKALGHKEPRRSRVMVLTEIEKSLRAWKTIHTVTKAGSDDEPLLVSLREINA